VQVYKKKKNGTPTSIFLPTAAVPSRWLADQEQKEREIIDLREMYNGGNMS
jgi:hypothetical protein